MPVRVKKLIGLFLILAWLGAYAVAAMALAIRVLPGAHWITEFLYYALAGTLWAVPAALLIVWMQREPAARS